METILEELAISNDDRSCLFTICLLDGIMSNKGSHSYQCPDHLFNIV